jgi:hypothetical protein
LKGEIEKKNQFKKKTTKIMRTKLRKITYHKLGLSNEIEILNKFQEQKLEIKKTRTEVEILI